MKISGNSAIDSKVSVKKSPPDGAPGEQAARIADVFTKASDGDGPCRIDLNKAQAVFRAASMALGREG